MPSKSNRQVDIGAFLLASMAAPASAFLIWTALDMALDGFPRGDVIGSFVGLLMILMNVTVWGLLPAAGFGMAFLLLLETLIRRPPSRYQMIAAGLAAAATYVGTGYLLALTGQDWVFIIAPWAVDAVAPGGHVGPGRQWTIVLSILASGGVAALAYAKSSGRKTVRQA